MFFLAETKEVSMHSFANNSPLSGANDNKPPKHHASSREATKRNHLHEVADQQLAPGGLLYTREALLAAAEEHGGAVAITPADQISSNQVGNQPLYSAVTTPSNQREVPHYHGGVKRPAEAYLVTEGKALVWVRWAHATSTPWQKVEVCDGSVLYVPSGQCHWVTWESNRGLAYVFKAPQQPGIGIPGDKGKTTCKFCPYSQDCEPPPGFKPNS
jgi:oxalate decarboxylase/phosphoglucose isomerase-like protein (cupin superfamily)